MYVTQAKENIEILNEKLLSLERNPHDAEILNDCFRIAHTLKGMAATMMFNRTAELAHAMENLLDAIRSERLESNPEIMDLFLQCVDTLELLIEASKEKRPELDVSDLIALIRGQLESAEPEKEEGEEEVAAVEEPPPEGRGEPAEKKAKGEKPAAVPRTRKGKKVEEKPDRHAEEARPITVTLSQKCDMSSARAFLALRRLERSGRIVKLKPSREEIESEKFGRTFTAWLETTDNLDDLVNSLSRMRDVEKVTCNVLEAAAAGEKEPVPQAGKKALSEIASVRVKMSRLDDLLDSVGEMVISKIRLLELAKSIDSSQLTEAVQALDRLTGELQYNVLRIRMVPIDLVFSKFPRMVRDLARQMGKEIDLVMEGHDIELDRTVIDKLGDLLVHLLRNSIDHGIESPEIREKLGKPRVGVVRLSANQEQNRVVIIVEDDGGGIDTDVIKKKALERGVLSSDALAMMDDEEIANILALPGFSTIEKVTTVSGRGVGLDAVKTCIEMFGGQMTIQSARGKGMRVVLTLPLTLAIILAMLVRVREETYAVPIDSIVETASVNEEDIKTLGGSKVLTYRGDIIPLVYLSRLLGLSDKEEGSEALIVEINQRKSAFVVHELIGQQEVVVKPLDRHLRGIPFLGGATILGSGDVVLILDVRGMLDYSKLMIRRTKADSVRLAEGGEIDAR